MPNHRVRLCNALILPMPEHFAKIFIFVLTGVKT